MPEQRERHLKFLALWLVWRTVLLAAPGSQAAWYHLGNAFAHRD